MTKKRVNLYSPNESLQPNWFLKTKTESFTCYKIAVCKTRTPLSGDYFRGDER